MPEPVSRRKIFCNLPLVILSFGSLRAQGVKWEGAVPAIAPALENTARHFTKYDVVLQPDKDTPEYWAGAPSVVRDEDGMHFEKYHSVCRSGQARRFT